jgi:methionyl-tRNA formyltransferase
MSGKASVIFMGTPNFSVAALRNLIKDFNVVLAVTQTDKLSVKDKKPQFSPVKIFAKNNGIRIFQPKSLKNKESAAFFKSLDPDFIVVAAYGKILPSNILDIPKFGCINVHGSILPAYRGASPVQQAILNGDSSTGVTIMQMDSGMDTGDMLFQDKIEILPEENTGMLIERIAALGANLLVKTLQKIVDAGGSESFRIKQDEKSATYSSIIKKNDGLIDWSKNSVEIECFVRAMNPWPSAFTYFNSKFFKIHKSRVSDYNFICESDGRTGKILSTDPAIVSCGSGSLELLEVQLEGKKRMTATEFFRGRKKEISKDSYFHSF